MNIMKSLAPDYLATMRDALTVFGNEIRNYLSDQGIEPAKSSLAATEQTAFDRPESLVTARSQATFLFESGGEHMGAFVKTITEPLEIIASFTCIRCILESCAFASWLLDPSIDAHTRVGRVFALRYEGIRQELKFTRAAGGKQSVLRNLKKRIDDVEQVALSIGYAPVVNSKGKRIGIGQQMPSATEVIELMLNGEKTYRLLSAVAHGHQWAIRKLAFKPAGTEEGKLHAMGVPIQGFEKTVNIEFLAHFGLFAAVALAKPLWYQCRYYAWDEPRLTALLDGTFDKLQAAQSARFWRVPSS